MDAGEVGVGRGASGSALERRAVAQEVGPDHGGGDCRVVAVRERVGRAQRLVGVGEVGGADLVAPVRVLADVHGGVVSAGLDLGEGVDELLVLGGVRVLERELASLCRKAATGVAVTAAETVAAMV